MPSRTCSQVKGLGSPLYRRRNHGRTNLEEAHLTRGLTSEEYFVESIFRSPFHTAPLMRCTSKTGIKFIAIGPVGVAQKRWITPEEEGGLVYLRDVAKGEQVCMIEKIPGDGGVLCRSGGCSASVAFSSGAHVHLKRAGRAIRPMLGSCLALRGIAGGGGAKMQPMLKAGNSFHKKKAKSCKYPHVSRVSMNHHDHRHGSSDGKRLGGRGCYKRGSPPGQKCALIAPKFSGRGRKGR